MPSANIVTMDGHKLSPARDIRYVYPNILEQAVKRFNAGAWPELMQVAEQAGATWDDVCDAMEALSGFLAKPIEDPEITMKEQMDSSGWFNVPAAAQVAVCAMIGSILVGSLYYSICETTALGAPPEGMAVIGERVRQLMCKKSKGTADESSG